ncbi:MAG: hypothetical protein AAGA85_10850 [Bacteroidota bacterium]
MITYYKRFFNISVLHDYYSNGLSLDLTLTPTEETQQLLKNNKLLFRQNEAGINLLYRSLDEAGTPQIELGDLDLVFKIQTTNRPEFLIISDLDQKAPFPAKTYTEGQLIYFENTPANASTSVSSPEELTHQLIDGRKPSEFTYIFELDPVPVPNNVLLRITDPKGSTTTVEVNESTEIRPDANDIYRVPVSLNKRLKGIYTFVVRDGADTTDLRTEQLYVDDDLVAEPLLGMLRIKYDEITAHHYGNAEYYALKFIRKETFWKFLVANKSQKIDLSVSDLDIEDTSLDSGDPYNVYTFTKGAEPDPTVRINGLDTVVFTSNVRIPFFQRPKLQLTLKQSRPPDVEITLIENLPNPSLRAVHDDQAEIYVFV